MHPSVPALAVMLSAAIWTGSGLAAPQSRSAIPVVGSRSATVTTWLDPAWSWRIPVTANPDAVEGAGNLLDFPLVLRLDTAQAALFMNAKSDGSDLVVTRADGETVLSREVIAYDATAQTAEIWFRADVLSKTQNLFYLYYGNPDTSLAAADGSVWTPDHLGVFHFAENPGAGILRDYGPNANDAATGFQSFYTQGDTVSGPVGQAWRFNGTSHWVDGDGIASTDSSFTISAWFACWNQLKSGDADFAFSSDTGFWHLSAKRNNSQRNPDFAGAKSFIRWQPDPLPDTLAHHYVWAMDGVQDTVRFYYDGVEQNIHVRFVNGVSKAYTGLQIGGNIGIASPLFGNPFDLMEGIVDEYRIIEAVRSPEWVATEYRNQAQADFFTLGTEEPFGTTAANLLWFDAGRFAEGARIRWELPENAPEFFFDLYRGEAEVRDRLTPKPVLSARRGSFTDPEPPAGAVSYWIAEHTRTGDLLWHGPVLLPASTPGVREPHLAQNRPNPFRNATRIRYTVPIAGRVQVAIFDVQGREVVRLLDELRPAGEQDLRWDGRDARGHRVAPGLYFYRLETAASTWSRRLVVLP